jgi:dolichol kinase
MAVYLNEELMIRLLKTIQRSVKYRIKLFPVRSAKIERSGFSHRRSLFSEFRIIEFISPLRSQTAMPLTKQEINRKLFHLFALLLPIGIFYLPKVFGISEVIPPVILTGLLLAIAVLETARFRKPEIQKKFRVCFGSMLRQEENKTITGSTYFIASAMICSFLFLNEPHISFMALTLFSIGDAAAAVAGQSIGKIKIGKKSLEGSLACFIACVILFVALFPHLPFLLDEWGGSAPLSLVLITAFAITLFELIPLKITKDLVINDNLSVPVIAGLVMKYFS